MIRIVILLLIFTQIQINAQMDTTSYSIGIVIAKNLKSQGFQDLNLASFNDALNDVFNTGELKIDLENANKNVQTYLANAKAAMHAENKNAGMAFLEENKNKPGVKVTSTGLQYVVLEEGIGTKHPTLLDKVNVHYHGTTIDGNVFDSSVDRGEPISFPLNGVINGWQEGLQLMTEGAKYRFFIPYNLAYGERGAGQDIKPFSALIFDVTLLGIE